MSKREFEDIYVEYLLDRLESARRDGLEEHLKGCAECKKELAELREALFSLPLTLPLKQPPAHVKELILKQAMGDIATGRAARTQRVWQVWALAASVLLLILGVYAWQQWQTGVDMDRQVSLLREENRRLRESNQSLSDRVDLLTRPDTKFLRMAGLENYAGTSGSAFLQPADRTAVAFIHELPPLSQAQDFQLWVIQNGRPPIPSQVFKSSGLTTEIRFNVPIQVDQVAILAVTIEPTGGSPQPTGPMVLAGRFEQ